MEVILSSEKAKIETEISNEDYERILQIMLGKRFSKTREVQAELPAGVERVEQLMLTQAGTDKRSAKRKMLVSDFLNDPSLTVDDLYRKYGVPYSTVYGWLRQDTGKRSLSKYSLQKGTSSRVASQEVVKNLREIRLTKEETRTLTEWAARKIAEIPAGREFTMDDFVKQVGMTKNWKDKKFRAQYALLNLALKQNASIELARTLLKKITPSDIVGGAKTKVNVFRKK